MPLYHLIGISYFFSEQGYLVCAGSLSEKKCKVDWKILRECLGDDVNYSEYNDDDSNINNTISDEDDNNDTHANNTNDDDDNDDIWARIKFG